MAGKVCSSSGGSSCSSRERRLGSLSGAVAAGKFSRSSGALRLASSEGDGGGTSVRKDDFGEGREEGECDEDASDEDDAAEDRDEYDPPGVACIARDGDDCSQ